MPNCQSIEQSSTSWKDRIRGILGSIYNGVLPILERRMKNKLLENDLKYLDYEGLIKKYFTEVENLGYVNDKELSALYDKEFTRKDKFEDKAKTNIAAVTVFVTLIMGSYKFMEDISKKYPDTIIYLIAAGVFASAVIYMFEAAYNAFGVISEENVVDIKHIGLNVVDKRKSYIDSICRNRIRNLRRNNFISASYSCLKNALICLVVVMLINIFPYSLVSDSKEQYVSSNKYDFFYSVTCGDVIFKVADREYVENMIVNKISNIENYGDNISFVDDDRSLFVKFSVDGHKVNVLLIEHFNK